MSSEAFVYFPDAMVSASEASGSVHCAPETTSTSVTEAQQQTEIPKLSAVVFTPTSEISDELLMEQVRQGTKDALSLIFRRHARAVRNVAYRILRNEAEADDLVQDVFLFIFRKANLFDASYGTARSWIIHVTYHRAFDRRRYLNTRRFYTDQGLDTTALNLPDRQNERLLYEWSLEGVWGKASAAKLRELLSPDQLATIELHFFEGCTLEEVAERMGQSLGNIRHHYYRGLEKLRKPAFAGKLRSK
jgi:RNA polymerase sigma-70 factor (ECF subfamily)